MPGRFGKVFGLVGPHRALNGRAIRGYAGQPANACAKI